MGILFITAALRVRGLYVSAIYERLRTHALTLSDFQRALGRPSQEQVVELQGFIREGDDKVRHFAAAALGKLAPDTFAAMLPELLESHDPLVRRLSFQMAPPQGITTAQLEVAVDDPDGWVVAAVAVAGANRRPPWERTQEILQRLWLSRDANNRAAAVWAAAFTGDQETVITGLHDDEPKVRLEAIRSFAKMKGEVPLAAAPMVACMRDTDAEVRREALRQAVRWAPPADDHQAFAEALVASLGSGDRETRRLASEAMAAQSPVALALTLPLLNARDDTAAATVEALIRSGQPALVRRVRTHLVKELGEALTVARMSTRVTAMISSRPGEKAGAYFYLRVALDDFARFAAESGLAAMRALHGKRGFATVELGLRSGEPHARVEGLETLLNFGPGWLAGPLAQLLDPGSFESGSARPLSHVELDELQHHEDRWVKEAAWAVSNGLDERMKELIALKQVPLFSTLTLEQLDSIDRLMVTRTYARGEPVFTRGDVGSELYVVLEGEIRIHLDHEGREVTLARHGPSSVLGEMAVFDEQPRSASAVATEKTTVRVLRRDKLQAIVHEHPEVLLEFVRNLSQRIRHMNDELESSRGREATPEAAGAAGRDKAP
jgi:hypothetical protein